MSNALKIAVAFGSQHVTPVIGREIAGSASTPEDEDYDGDEVDDFAIDETVPITEPHVSASTKLGRRSVRLPIAAPVVAAAKPKPERKVTRTSVGIPASFDELLDETVDDNEVYGKTLTDTAATRSVVSKKPTTSTGGQCVLL